MRAEQLTLKTLLEAGVHFGHKTQRWNPKMQKYIHSERQGIHIVDLPKTITLMKTAMDALYNIVKNGGRVLFVGTKIQARDIVKTAAQNSGQYYVDIRWLGGTLTNWKTIALSIQKLRQLQEKTKSSEFAEYTKKEQLDFHLEIERLERNIGGIKDMGGLPDAVFVLDVNRDRIAVKEARDCGISIFGIVDTNSDPDGITYPIPGNDDSAKSIQLYCDVAMATIIDGIKAELSDSGVDVGSSKYSGASSEEADKLLEAFAPEKASAEAVPEKKK